MSEYHQCHFCGTYVIAGYESNGARHYLSDCRPDLVQHEIGSTCTYSWDAESGETPDCYGYQDRNTRQWTKQHEHFDPDVPM